MASRMCLELGCQRHALSWSDYCQEHDDEMHDIGDYPEPSDLRWDREE